MADLMLYGAKTLEEMKRELETVQRVVGTITDYTNFVKGKRGTGYSGPKLGDGTAYDMPITDDKFISNALGSFEIMFDQNKGVPQRIGDIDQLATNVGLQTQYAITAKRGLLDAYDNYIVKTLIDNASNKIKLIDAVDNVLSKADFLKARELLNSLKAPLKGRTCLISPAHESQLYDIPEFVSRDKIADASAIKEGVIGRLFGFDVLLYNDMPVVSTTGLTTGTVTKPVTLFYQSLALGFGRQKEFGVKVEAKAGDASDWFNTYSVFGATIQEANYVVSLRNN